MSFSNCQSLLCSNYPELWSYSASKPLSWLSQATLCIYLAHHATCIGGRTEIKILALGLHIMFSPLPFQTMRNQVYALRAYQELVILTTHDQADKFVRFYLILKTEQGLVAAMSCVCLWILGKIDVGLLHLQAYRFIWASVASSILDVSLIIRYYFVTLSSIVHSVSSGMVSDLSLPLSYYSDGFSQVLWTIQSNLQPILWLSRFSLTLHSSYYHSCVLPCQ